MRDAGKLLRARAYRVDGVAWARGRRFLTGGDRAGGECGAIMPFLSMGVLVVVLLTDLWAVQSCGDDDEPPYKAHHAASETQLQLPLQGCLVKSIFAQEAQNDALFCMHFPPPIDRHPPDFLSEPLEQGPGVSWVFLEIVLTMCVLLRRQEDRFCRLLLALQAIT